MTQEQKAKAYDEAIERAKEVIKNNPDFVRVTPKLMEEIFPELEEKSKAYMEAHKWESVNKFMAMCRGEQKPSWSEEDEKMVEDALQFAHEYGRHGLWCWLKSLKDRIK